VEEPSILGVEEVAIAVKDNEAAASLFKTLFGFDFELEWEIPFERIKVKSHRIDQTQLQFISPTDKESVVAKFIAQKGEGLNHIALRVKNLKVLAARLKEKGARLIPEEPSRFPTPSEVGQRPPMFLFTRNLRLGCLSSLSNINEILWSIE